MITPRFRRLRALGLPRRLKTASSGHRPCSPKAVAPNNNDGQLKLMAMAMAMMLFVLLRGFTVFYELDAKLYSSEFFKQYKSLVGHHMNFDVARELAASWVSLATQGTAVLYRDKTIALPYGWVFFYNSPEFLADSSNHESSLVGNVPILVNRINGELRVLGPRYMDRLKELEREMPTACLQMKPENPRW